MNQNLLRKAEVGGAGAVETNHERIRAAVLDALKMPGAGAYLHRSGKNPHGAASAGYAARLVTMPRIQIIL